MNIFNSLGSNYSFSFAIKAIFADNSDKHKLHLLKLLEEKYEGKAFLFYKGRDAIQEGLKILNLEKDDKIAINGFTCYAVYNAIEKAGLKPILIDIEKDQLNFTPQSLKENILKNKIKAVIIQNTLGYPCQIEEISNICKENNLFLIEDLAHSIGTKYSNGRKAGSYGDIVILSFSQDKIVDGISGGALIIRNKKYDFGNQHLKPNSYSSQLKDRFYPYFTFKIRTSYKYFLGKAYHKFIKELNLLSKPMDEKTHSTLLSNWYCKLIIKAFNDIEENIDHRKKIANIYYKNLPKELMIEDLKNIDDSTNLRFPILIEEREKVIKKLKQNGIYLSDIWYDAPIAPKRYMQKIKYENDCPNSEFISSKILNLPTHRNVSEKDAEKLCEILKQCLIQN